MKLKALKYLVFMALLGSVIGFVVAVTFIHVLSDNGRFFNRDKWRIERWVR